MHFDRLWRGKLLRSAGAFTVMAGLMLGAPLVEAKTFRMAFQGNLNTLDPYTINETFTHAMNGSYYEGLTRRGPDLTIIPGLAERWELVEPTRWRFHLRKNVKFHGGEAFTADDVLFSAERIRQPNSDLKARIPADAQFVKVDDFTVDVVLKTPNPILIADWDTFYVMSKAWTEKNNASEVVSAKATTPGFTTLNANGTGPFSVVSHQPGVKTVLKANPGWWNAAKKDYNIDEVVFTPIANDATRVAALLSGEVDWADPIPPQDQERVNSSPTTSMLAGPETRTIYLGMDQMRDKLVPPAEVPGDKNPFKDIRVRKAMFLAIDEDAIASRIMRGLARPSALMIDPNLVDKYGKDFVRPKSDPAQSEKLFDEAGYPRVGGAQGTRFTVGLDCPNDRYVNDAAICQAVIGMLARVGVKVVPIIQPRAQYFAKILAGGGYNSNFYLLGWTPGTNDSHNVLAQIVGCRDEKGSGGRGVANVAGYCNPKIEELAQKVLVETNTDVRAGLVRDAWKILIDDWGYIPLHQQALAWGISKKVKMAQCPDNIVMLYHVQLAD